MPELIGTLVWSGGELGSPQGSLKFLIGGLLLVGWALGQWFFSRRGATKLPLGGLEFLVLGGVAGHILPRTLLQELQADVLDPFMTVALGLVGFLFGIHLSLGEIMSRGWAKVGRIILTSTVMATAIWFALSHPMVGQLLHWPEEGQETLALLFASMAPISSGVFLRAGRAGKHVPKKIFARVLLFSGITPLIAMAFLTMSVLATTQHGLAPKDVNWVLIACLTALILILFLLAASLVPNRGGDQFAVHMGLLCLVSGTAAVLDFPALVISFLVGFLLAHLPGLVKDLDGTISIMDRPLYFVLMVMAGLQVEWTNTYILEGGLVVASLVVVTKILGHRGMGLILREQGGKRVGRYLISMGPITVALGLSVFLVMDPGLVRDTFLSTLCLMVILAEVVQLLYSLHKAKQAENLPKPEKSGA